jgi:hypothetical protein
MVAVLGYCHVGCSSCLSLLAVGFDFCQAILTACSIRVSLDNIKGQIVNNTQLG